MNRVVEKKKLRALKNIRIILQNIKLQLYKAGEATSVGTLRSCLTKLLLFFLACHLHRSTSTKFQTREANTFGLFEPGRERLKMEIFHGSTTTLFRTRFPLASNFHRLPYS